jgi:YVTN family beta-propeller protein
MRSDNPNSHARASANLGLLLALVLVAIPLGAATARIYVTNRGGTTISVIDPTTNTVVQTIRGLESPEVVRFSPDGNRLYIGLRSEDNFYVMDRKSGKTIKKIPTSGWVNDALVTSDGKLVLLAIRNTGVEAEDAGALDVIDAKSLTKIKSIPTKRGLHDLALTGDNKFVAAGSPGGQLITVFDLQNMDIAWTVNYDQGVLPVVIESNPDGSGHRIFAQLTQTNGFSVVDFATHKEVTRIVNPDEPKGFPPGCEGISHGIGIAPDGKTLWSNSRPANAVFVYSLPDLKLLGHVSLPETPVAGKAPRGGGPAWVTFTPDSKTVYVSTCGTKSITAIDVEGIKKITDIPVGEMPDRISTLVMK